MAKNLNRIFSSTADVYQALDEKVNIYDKFAFSHPTKTEGKLINLSLGRIWINLLFPPEFPLINEQINGKKLSQLIKKVIDDYPPEVSADLISKINQEVYRIGTYCPTTFEIDSLILPANIKKEKEELQKNGPDDPIAFNNELKKITKDLENNGELNDYRFFNIHKSGAKDAPITGLMIGRGSVSDLEGNISKPLRTSLDDGQSIESFYQSAAEARLGFYYKSAISSKPGYLARRVTMASAHIMLDDSIKDCGTKKYFKLTVTPDLAKLLKYRYHVVNGKPKLIENVDDIIDKTINLRSPLYCKSEKGICPICYGDNYKKINTKNIGVLAGGDINDIALNTYMKMRHKSSIPELVKVNFIKDLTQYNLLTPDFKKNLIADENTITANNDLFVKINTDDYIESTIIESVDYYLIPGILTIYLSEDSTQNWTLPFSYQIKLMKSNDIEKNGKEITIRYNSGDKIVEQDFYPKEFDVSVMERMLEGQMKYISTPEMLVLSLQSYLGGLDLTVIETIVQNMFRDASDLSKPARLTDYTNYEICGQKKLPFVTSWVNAMSFENVNKAIKTGLITGANAPDDPITKIVNEKY